MKQFTYIIKDPEGIHARPAGLLVKAAALFSSSVSIAKEDKTVDAKRILGVMGLGAKQGQQITIIIEGDDEEKAYSELQSFFQANL